MVAPVPSQPKITYPYGTRNPRYAAGYHTGDDYFAAYGAKIVATRAGKVSVAGFSSLWGEAYGRVVVVDVHRNDGSVVKCLYAHTSRVTVKVGDRVKTGQRIAKVGTSGTNSTGSHLHYEERLDPFRYADRDRKPKFQNFIDPKVRALTKLRQSLSSQIDRLRHRRKGVAAHLKRLKN